MRGKRIVIMFAPECLESLELMNQLVKRMHDRGNTTLILTGGRGKQYTKRDDPFIVSAESVRKLNENLKELKPEFKVDKEPHPFKKFVGEPRFKK